MKPIALTAGDPYGIGPELIIKAILAQAPLAQQAIVIAHKESLVHYAKQLGVRFDDLKIQLMNLVDVAPFNPELIGTSNKYGGEIAYQAILAATTLAREKKVNHVVTAPISKAALHMAGHHYPGHTELLAVQANPNGEPVPVRMMLANDELRTVLVSIHVSLKQALEQVKQANVFSTIKLCQEAFISLGISKPRIAVAGLNPHAGEGGLFGLEEITEIKPAIDQAIKQGIDVSGPYPPDTIFMRARGLKEFDVVIAMYHDQGLIPVKYLGVEKGVNVTLGLPYLRTSPDHGTAFDIAGKGIASVNSLMAAINFSMDSQTNTLARESS